MEAMDLQTDLDRQIIESALYPECIIDTSEYADFKLLLDVHQPNLINSSIQSKPNSVKTDDGVDNLSMGFEWLDEKMDLSIFDCPEGLSDLLDDPLAMAGDPTTLLDSLMDLDSSLIDINVNSQPKNSDDTLLPVKSESLNDSVVEIAASPEPTSPVGIVPDPVFTTGVQSPQTNHTIILTEPSSPQIVLDSLSADTYLSSDGINMMIFISDGNKEVTESVSSPSSPGFVLSDCSSVSNTLSDTCSSSEDLKFVATEVRSDQLKPYSSPSHISPSLQKSARTRPKTKSASSSAHRTSQKEGRRERKRVQNKEAAARYRIKKRSEGQALHEEMGSIEGKNAKLKEKVKQLSSEIKYLKGLMKEMFKARGLLK